jgi:hypothetical protein
MNNKDLAKIALVVLGVLVLAHYIVMPMLDKYASKEA